MQESKHKNQSNNQSKRKDRLVGGHANDHIINTQRNFASILAFRFVKGIGRQRAHWLCAQVQQPADIWSLTHHEWDQLLDQEEQNSRRIALHSRHREAIQSFQSWDRVQEILNNTRYIGVDLLPFWAKQFQHQLYHIPDPPLVLWAIGNLDLLLQPTIAIVGTRKPSLYAQQQTRAITQECLAHGLTVVSGLALGIDTIAQSECVRQEAPTIAVLGSALNCLYPKQHQRTAQQILDQGGLLLSEYPPNTKAESYHFPERNRIISGISKAVLVMESGLKGGSMITARLALDQGREVLVLPHQRDNPKGLGNLHLVHEGAAQLFIDIDKMFEFIPALAPKHTGGTKEAKTKTLHDSDLSSLDAIKIHTLEELSRNHGESFSNELYEFLLLKHPHLEHHKFSVHLFELEMTHWILQLPGGNVRLLRPLNPS